MSGIRDHKLFTVTISGTRVYPERVSDGCGSSNPTGRTIREKDTHVHHIVAPLACIAEAHVRYWAQYGSWDMVSVKITTDEVTKIDAFIQHHTY